MFSKRIQNRKFEFHYLVELTRQRIKPLSRWEKFLDRKTVRWLKKQDIVVETVSRRTVLNRPVFETVFSRSSRYVDHYIRKFNHTPISHVPETQHLEGFLFGYPSCCVQQFIRRPYCNHSLPKDVQSLFFHWACTDCRITPELVPYYRAVFDQVKAEWPEPMMHAPFQVSPVRRAALAAAACMLISTGLFSAETDANHFIPLPEDENSNGLTRNEEIVLGAYCYGLQDPCQTAALFFKTRIDSLPDTVQTDQAYKIDHMLRGVVPCPKCGENINMGYVTLVHPKRLLQMDLPYLGVHFMEHGYFSYGDDASYERVDIDTLKRILYPYDPDHMLPVTNDTDGDGLTDAEEDSLWIDGPKGIPDFNDNTVPDGADLAEELVRLFSSLSTSPDGAHSRIEEFPVWGTENCEVCGSNHNMGYIEITNPENQRMIQIPYLALHALAHGSFQMNGTVHPNQHVDAVELVRAMKTHLLFIRNDPDRDGLTNEEEAYFGFNPNQADTNEDTVLDGVTLARAFADSIMALPTEPSTTEPWAEFLGMDGIHLCSVCGREVVMGIINIYNPLINTSDPYEVTNYAFHFLEHGSFACSGAQDSRLDAILLSQYLNILPTQVTPHPVQSAASRFILKQNYPNPFNPSTTLSFELKDKAHVTVDILDVYGRIIRHLIREDRPAGNHDVLWDGRTDQGVLAATGVYVVQMCAKGPESEVRKFQKIVMVK